jgi:hypothetical protein
VDEQERFRHLRAKIAANMSWARTPDRVGRLAPAREGMTRKLEREVDPEGLLDPEELARRVASARRARMQQLALRSARVRRERRMGVSSQGDTPGIPAGEDLSGVVAGAPISDSTTLD